MKVFVVKQHDITDCGPACLSSVIKYYGGYVPIEVLRIKCETDNTGTSVYNMIKTAEIYNFKAKALRIKDINDLSKTKVFPCIVHLKLKSNLFHFAVLYELRNDSVILMDPSQGKIKLSLKEFQNIFTNVLIILQPQSTLIKYEKPNTVRKVVLLFFKENKIVTIKLIICSVILVIVSVFLSYFIKLGSYLSNEDFGLTIFKYFILLYLLVYVMKNLIDYIKNKFIIYMNKNISVDLFSKFSHQLFILPLNFIKSKTSGEIISRYNELQQVNKMVPEFIITTSLDLMMAIISFFFATLISLKLSFCCLVLMIIYTIYSYALKNPTLHNISENINLSSNFNTDVIDSVNTIISTKYLNNEDNMEKRLARSGSKYLENNMNLETYVSKCNFVKSIVFDTGKWCVLSLGIYLCLIKKLSIIDLFTFELVTTYFFESIKDILGLIPSICYLKSTLLKLNEFSIVLEEDEGIYDFKNGDITIDNLSFSYDNNTNILKNVSFKVKKNEKILLKGDSGTGKSTICNLLSRQINPPENTIKIDNIDIKKYKIKDYRKNITYIGQKDSLIVDTIMKNIIYERNILDKELKNICRICEIDKIVENKLGKYDAFIMESASNISGGEKQRIVLARGLLNPGKIIILDEALSEVNQEMEERIIKRIFKYFKDKTIIYVSHKEYNKIFNRKITLCKNA